MFPSAHAPKRSASTAKKPIKHLDDIYESNVSSFYNVMEQQSVDFGAFDNYQKIQMKKVKLHTKLLSILVQHVLVRIMNDHFESKTKKPLESVAVKTWQSKDGKYAKHNFVY